MKRSHLLQQQLKELERWRFEADSEELFHKLRGALDDNAFVAARAASIVAERDLYSLVPAVARSLENWLDTTSKSDPGCAAKTALAKALQELGYRDDRLFLRGIRWIQLEPIWGGKEDVAAPFRAICALGLASSGSPELMEALADLLADAELDARLGAVRALVSAGHVSSIPLLRYKVLIGDSDNRVRYECVVALLQLAPNSSLPLVERLLDDQDPVTSELAALALAESRQQSGCQLLIDWSLRTVESKRRKPALNALAMMRTEDAVAFLLGLISESPREQALAAARALAIHRHDLTLWQRVERRLRKRQDINIDQVLAPRRYSD